MDPQSFATTWRWPLEIAALAAVLTPLLVVLLAWGTLPERIPMHFNAAGRPDSWGPRWLIVLHPLVALAIYGFIGTLTRTLPWYASSEVIAAPLPIAGPIRVLLPLLFGYIAWCTVRIARREAERLNPLVLCSFLAVLLASPLAALFLLAPRR
jgi:hypothetical protein